MIITDKQNVVYCLLKVPKKSIRRGIASDKAFDMWILYRYCIVTTLLVAACGFGILANFGEYTFLKFSSLLPCIYLVVAYFFVRSFFKNKKEIQSWLENRENVVILAEERYLRPVSLVVLLNSESQAVDTTRPVISYEALMKCMREQPELVDGTFVRYFTCLRKWDQTFDTPSTYLYDLDEDIRLDVFAVYDHFAHECVHHIVAKVPELIETWSSSDYRFDYSHDEAEKVLLDHNLRQLLKSERA